MTKPYVPAFNLAKGFVKKFGKNKVLQELCLDADQLAEKDLAEELKNIFQEVADKADVTSMEFFLNRASQLMADYHPSWVEELKRVQESQDLDIVKKQDAFKKLLLDANLIAFFARRIKEYRMLNRDQEEYYYQVHQKYYEVAKREAEQRANQSVYGSLEAYLIRSAIGLLFYLCDLTLVEAGMKPIFMAVDEEKESPTSSEKVRFIPMKM